MNFVHCLLLSTQPINRTWSLTCSWMQAWKSANLSTIKKHVFQLWYQYKHMYLIHMKEYAAPVTDNGGWPLVNESSWNKNRIAFQILTSFPCVEKYKISAALLYFATIHLREVSHQYPWLITGVFFYMHHIQCINRTYKSQTAVCVYMHCIYVYMYLHNKYTTWIYLSIYIFYNIRKNNKVIK